MNQSYNQNNYQSYQQPYQQPVSPDTYTGDPKFKPLGAWAFLGYGLLFLLPTVGPIVAIVLSLNNDNINRRNFARGYLILLGLLAGLVVLLSVLIFVLLGTSLSALTEYIRLG